MKRILVWPDWHLPYHHKKATKIAIDIAKDFKPHCVVSLGDMYDCNSVSSHDPNPDKHARFVDERDESNEVLDALLSALPVGCEKHILLGNHEDMLRRFVWRKASALSGLVSLDDPFGLVKRKFNVIPYRHMLKIGKVNFSHDIGGAGANAARNALARVQGNIIQGHTHRATLIYETNAQGKAHFACTGGWLGDPSHTTSYMDLHSAQTQWTHSVVKLFMRNDGSADIELCPVFRGITSGMLRKA